MSDISMITSIVLDGEREYKQAVSDITSDMRVLDSEMKLVSTRFAEQTDSTEALTEKSRVLEGQIEKQREKIATLKGALENAENATDRNQRSVNDWKVKLNNAESALEKMERQLRDNQKALEDSSESTKKLEEAQEGVAESSGGLGNAVNGLAGKLGIQLPQGAMAATNSMGGMAAGVGAVLAVVVEAAQEIKEFSAAITKLTFEQAKQARTAQTLSQTMGMTTDEYQEWDYVLKSVGSSAEEAQGDISQLAEKALDASKGSEEARESFRQLGVDIYSTGSNLKSQGEIFEDVVDGLRRITNETERNAIASQLLSTTGEKLVPILNMTSEEVEGMKNRAHELGVVLDGETLAAFENLTKAGVEYRAVQEGLKNQMAEGLAPSIEHITEMLTRLFQQAGDTAERSGIVDIMSSLFDIAAASEPVYEALLNTIGYGTENTLHPLADMLDRLADRVAIINNYAAITLEAMDELRSWTIGESLDFSRLDKYYQNIQAIKSGIGNNAQGTDFWRGGLTWVGERGPEIINLPRGTQILSNQESMALAGGVNNTYNITIDAKSVKEFNDIVRIAEGQRMSIRMGGIRE